MKICYQSFTLLCKKIKNGALESYMELPTTMGSHTVILVLGHRNGWHFRTFASFSCCNSASSILVVAVGGGKYEYRAVYSVNTLAH